MIDHYEETKYTNQLPIEYVVKQVQIAWVENTDDFEIIMLGAYRNIDDALAALEKWCVDNNLNGEDDSIYLHCDAMELK